MDWGNLGFFLLIGFEEYRKNTAQIYGNCFSKIVFLVTPPNDFQKNDNPRFDPDKL